MTNTSAWETHVVSRSPPFTLWIVRAIQEVKSTEGMRVPWGNAAGRLSRLVVMDALPARHPLCCLLLSFVKSSG